MQYTFCYDSTTGMIDDAVDKAYQHVNELVREKVYEVIKSWADTRPDGTRIEWKCGMGTYGLWIDSVEVTEIPYPEDEEDAEENADFYQYTLEELEPLLELMEWYGGVHTEYYPHIFLNDFEENVG